MVGVPGQVVPVEDLGHPLGALGCGHALVLQPEGDVLGHGGMDDLRVRVLEDEPDAAAHLAHRRPGVQAVDQHPAGGRHDQPVEQPREGALARPVGPHDPDAVLGEPQVQPVEDDALAVGVVHAEELDAARRIGGDRRSAPLAAQSHGVAGTRRGRSITG